MALSPQLRDLINRASVDYRVCAVDHKARDERRKVIADLCNAARIASAAHPERAHDFWHAAGYATGYIGRDEHEAETMGEEE